MNKIIKQELRTMEDPIDLVEQEFIKDDLPDMRPGDLIRVHERVEEGSKRRTQVFEGVLLRLSGSGTSKMIVIRKISAGIGVEKTLPVHSPKVEKIEVVKKNKTRQSRPYYLRNRTKW